MEIQRIKKIKSTFFDQALEVMKEKLTPEDTMPTVLLPMVIGGGKIRAY